MSTSPYATRSKAAMATRAGMQFNPGSRAVPAGLPETENANDENTGVVANLGEYITTAYGLLRHVFSYLPMNDLRRASKVCSAWKEAAEREKDCRDNIDWAFWKKSTYSTVLNLLNVAFRRETYCAPQVCLSFVCGRGIEPHISCGRSNVNCPYSGQKKGCGNTHCVCQYVQKVVHLESSCILMEADGIVGTSTNLDNTEEVESLQGCVSTVLLPKVSGVRIRSFFIDEETLMKFRQGEYHSKEVCTIMDMDPEISPLRCVLLFCNTDYQDDILIFLTQLINVQKEQFVIGGGFFNTAHYVTDTATKCCKRGAIAGIAFSGENMQCASTIFNTDVALKSDAECVMEEFTTCELSERNSVAFMFACCGRGKFHYRSKNVESSVFRSFFPKTPLLGAFVQGEIGQKFLVGSKHENEPTSAKRPRMDIEDAEELMNSYTTVLVYLSFGTRKSKDKE